MSAPAYNVVSAEGLTELNNHFLTKSYVTGFQASNDDLTIFNALKKEPSAEEHPHLHRWFNHVKALISSRFPGEAAGVTINNRPAKAEKAPKKEKAEKAKKVEAPKEDAAEAAAKAAAKLHAKCEKEGGKKGVEIAGAADMGGLDYFCTTLELPDGNLELLKVALDAMNKEIDPTEEESKGGSGAVGKMVFSAGKEKLACIAYGSDNDKIKASEWMKAVVDGCPKFTWESVGEQGDKLAMAYALGDSKLGLFPIKMKDDAMTEAFKHLRENDAFPADDDDDGDDECFGDDAFDEWN